jgi:hypothetical protein
MKLNLCIMLLIIAVGRLNGQTNKAASECHQMLASFAGKESAYFDSWDTQGATETRNKIQLCALESYSQLTKLDLAAGVVVTDFLDTKLNKDQLMLTMKINVELQSKLDELRAKLDQVTNPTKKTDEVQVTIVTLPSGYIKSLSLAGGQDRCTADGPETMMCEKYVTAVVGGLGSWAWDTNLVAMLASVKTSYGATSYYLIGCPASPSCSPLVPGDYPATMSGANGLVISGLVSEEAKDDTKPHHGIYTILLRVN